MDEREFLRTGGLLGMAGLLPVTKLFAGDPPAQRAGGGCVLIPSETTGPFPLDLTAACPRASTGSRWKWKPWAFARPTTRTRCR